MPQRVHPEEARRRIEDPNGALLVCAYDDTEKCQQFGIEEAIPYPHLKQRLDSIPKSQELVFFCA